MNNLDPTWSSALPDELAFWQYWLTTEDPEPVAGRTRRLNALDRPIIQTLADSAKIGERVRVLDVGAGPLTTLGVQFQGGMAEVIAIDPLAEEYNQLLAKVSIEPPIPTRYGVGEQLVDQFGVDRFHGVYCANALDHCSSPMTVIRQMVRVARPGGTVQILCHRNVGELENYQGLHQWNITVHDERPIIWQENLQIDIADELTGTAEIEGFVDDADLVHLKILKAMS